MKGMNMLNFINEWMTKEKKEKHLLEEYWNLFPRKVIIRSSPSFISSAVLQEVKARQKIKLIELEKARKFSNQELCFHRGLGDGFKGISSQKDFLTTKEKEKQKILDQERLLARLAEMKKDKIIISTPGGLHLSSMMGSVMFLHEMTDLSKFVFSGASAGAFCSLFLCYRKNLRELLLNIFAELLPVRDNVSIFEEMLRMKEIILKHTTTKDFDLDRLFVGVVRFDYTACQGSTKIHCFFEDLEDALNCCIASSNIPFLTGKWNQTYQNEIVWDGVFSSYPYLNIFSSSFVLSPDLWQASSQIPRGLQSYTSLFSFRSLDFLAKFWKSYNEAITHKHFVTSFVNPPVDI